MYICHGVIPISGGYSVYHWRWDELVLTSWYDQLVVALMLPQIILSAKLLTPKDGGIFALSSLTNGSHQLNFRSLLILCFVSFL